MIQERGGELFVGHNGAMGVGADDGQLGSMQITVIGEVGVRIPDSSLRRLQPAQRQLLSLLVAAGPAGLSADRLADEIWPDRLPTQWQASLRMTVSRLRRNAGIDFVRLIDGRYRLAVVPHQVDAWYASELTARGAVTLSAGDSLQLSNLLASNDIYPGVEPTLTIDSSIREIEQAQADLVFAAAQQGIPLERSTLRSLHRRVIASPYDQNEGTAIARLHAITGQLSTAQQILELLRSEVHMMFGTDLDAEARLLERQILSGAWGSQRSEIETDNPLRDSPRSLPAGLVHDLQEPSIRSHQIKPVAELLLAPGSQVVLVGGPAGAERLAFAAAVLHHAGPILGRVLLGSCSDGVTVAYEPFLKFLPGLRRRLSEPDSTRGISHQTVLWSAAVEELQEIAGRSGLTVVIEECHNIDSASMELLLFVLRSSMQSPVKFLLVGRDDVERSEFKRLASQLRSLAGIEPVALQPLDISEIETLLAVAHPHASSTSLRALAEETLQHSNGLPAVVNAIIKTLDPMTLQLPASGTGTSLDVFSEQVDALSPTALSVGVAAAVLGSQCAVSDLAEMSDLDFDVLLNAIEELLDTGLLTETAGVDQIAFAHQLAMDEFMSRARAFRLRQLHMRARTLSVDPHRRARHDLLAVPTVPAEEARGSQLRSARILHAEGSYREASGTYRNALAIDPTNALEVDDAIRFADSVSRIGALTEAADLRSEIVAHCFDEGDWGGALKAALVGLPEAELVDGDPERFAQLSAIPYNQIDPDRRFPLAIHLTRQASLLGRERVAYTWVERAVKEARTEAERSAAVVAWRQAHDVSTPPAERLRRIEAALGQASHARSRIELLQLQALDLYQIGRTEEALVVNEEFRALAVELSEPLREWHARLFECMNLFTVGKWELGRQRAKEALHHGQRFGIAVAAPTHMAQEFFLMWLQGTHGTLAPIFDTTPPDDASSLLFRAAHAVSLEAIGQIDRAIRDAGVVAERVLRAPAAHGLASVALVAPVLARGSDKDLIESVRRLFLPFRGSALIVGAGVANLGPVDRYLAMLAGPLTEKEAVSIVELADGLSMPLWRLMSRLDLARAAGCPPEMAQVVPIAAGTDLECLLPKA